MELFGIFLIVIIIGGWVLRFFSSSIRFFSSSIPSTSTSAILNFKKSLPEGFGYPYTLDGTGYAVNVKNKKLLILVNFTQCIYEREKIRGFKYGINEAGQFYGAVGIRDKIDTGLKNRSMKKNAYENNGIFVELADIDTPVVQIKFSNEAELRRSVEILQQFLDGTLADYEEYLKRKQ